MLGAQWGKRSLFDLQKKVLNYITDISENRLNRTREKISEYMDTNLIEAKRASVAKY